MREMKQKRARNVYSVKGIVQMKKRAYIKADIADPDDERGYGVDVQVGGDLYFLVKLLREVIEGISGSANVSVEKLVSAAMAKNPEAFEKDYEILFTEYLKGRNKDEIKN